MHAIELQIVHLAMLNYVLYLLEMKWKFNKILDDCVVISFLLNQYGIPRHKKVPRQRHAKVLSQCNTMAFTAVAMKTSVHLKPEKKGNRMSNRKKISAAAPRFRKETKIVSLWPHSSILP